MLKCPCGFQSDSPSWNRIDVGYQDVFETYAGYKSRLEKCYVVSEVGAKIALLSCPQCGTVKAVDEAKNGKGEK